MTRKTGCHLSLNLINSSTLSHSPPNLFLSVEFHCVSDPGPRNDRCLVANLSARVTLAIHAVSLCFVSPFDVIEHRHADNSSMELFGFAHFVHELLNFLDELQCGESWENIPLEFHRNSVQVSVQRNQPNCFSQTVFDVGFWFTFLKHNTKFENS